MKKYIKHERSCLTTLRRDLKIRRTFVSSVPSLASGSIYGKCSRQFREEYRPITMSGILSFQRLEGFFLDEENLLCNVNSGAEILEDRRGTIGKIMAALTGCIVTMVTCHLERIIATCLPVIFTLTLTL